MQIHDAEHHLGSDDWERRLGDGIRRTRLAADLTQATLARQANLDRTTVARMERGEGGSIRSLVQVARALHREDWIDSLGPRPTTVSPMQMLAAQRSTTERRRARTRRGSGRGRSGRGGSATS